jgi:DNA-binding NarL/FixJ family response regulator
MKPSEADQSREANTGGFATDTRPLRILLVDDDSFMLEVIGKLLRQSDRYTVVAEAGDVRTALSACEAHRPDVVLLDINLPDETGIAAVQKFRSVCPEARILLCTAEATDERIIDALRSGAQGFVEKTNRWQDFIIAIERVAAGEHYLCARSTAAFVRFSQEDSTAKAQKEIARLTPRETEVLKLVSRGDASKEVASKLGVSVGTVDVHRANVMKKLNVRNIAGLVAFAFETGLLG